MPRDRGRGSEVELFLKPGELQAELAQRISRIEGGVGIGRVVLPYRVDPLGDVLGHQLDALELRHKLITLIGVDLFADAVEPLKAEVELFLDPDRALGGSGGRRRP